MLQFYCKFIPSKTGFSVGELELSNVGYIKVLVKISLNNVCWEHIIKTCV